MPRFRDRRDAGRQLAAQLSAYRGNKDVLVLALPRGGVPVAYEVARALGAPLDLMLVRKLGAPGHEELALGAIAPPDICVFNADVLQSLTVAPEAIDKIVAAEKQELARRNEAYRGGKPPPQLAGCIAILVDDGVATGADMRAALDAAAVQHPLKTVVAVPVASAEACDMLQQKAQEVIRLRMPALFFAVGQAYDDFSATSDEEVLALLAAAQKDSGDPALHGRKEFGKTEG
jgi:predicted phosphoribosyltransferase